jgi:NAD-dependent SIR2 family protein deacetylase
MKVCTKCGEAKPPEDFPKDARLRTGLSSQCRACHAIRSHKSYMNNREARIAKSTAYRKADPERWNSYRRRKYAREHE